MQIDINSRKQLNKPENYAAFYSLLNRLPTSDRDALKESIVSQYTEGRTTSLRDMTLKEYSAAVSAMQKRKRVYHYTATLRPDNLWVLVAEDADEEIFLHICADDGLIRTLTQYAEQLLTD